MHALPASPVTPLQNLPVLPVNHAVALKTWFNPKILERGFMLIRECDILCFSFRRRHASLVTSDHVRAFVHMAPGKGRLRFIFRDGTCSLCEGRTGGTRCYHVAALAMLCLHGNDRLKTVADAFPAGSWETIAGYLCNRASLGGIRAGLLREKDQIILHATGREELDLRIRLSKECARELSCLHRLEEQSSQPECRLLKKTEQRLEELTATNNEKTLNEQGSRSKQQHMESSLYMHLARLCFLHLGDDPPQVHRTGQGIYRLLTSGSEPVFELTLPRHHTWELLDKPQLTDRSEKTIKQDRAEQFCRVRFDEKTGDLVVENRCRLADGREFSLRELEPHRYGLKYRLDDLVFSLQPMPEQARLSRIPRGQLSLFDTPTAAGGEEKTGFTVPTAEVTDFLAANGDQLACGHHDVAPEILEMKIVQAPDRLILDAYEEDRDWCYLAGWYGVGNHRIRLTDLLRTAEQGRSLLTGPVTLQLDRSFLSWFHRLGTDRIVEKGSGERIRLRRSEFLALSAQIGDLDMECTTSPETLPEFVLTDDERGRAVNNPMPSHLRDYQRHGTAWMYQLQQYRLGGILADDMGLGKTHQALALISLLAEGDNRFLLVCPAAVLSHWPEKQERFFPDLSMAVYHGPGRDLAGALESRIILTTYGIMRRDVDQLADIPFRLILFDEMHALKNRATGAHAAAARLRADTIIGLTGTPVENRIAELAGLLSICLPALFRLSPVQNMFSRGDTPENRKRLQHFVAPFILRRTRNQVLDDLPECSEDIRLCTLSDDQVAAYRQAADQALGNLEEDEKITDFSHVLTTILRLKQICNHLAQLEKSTDWTLHPSGKWDEFTGLVRQSLEAELKVVVFSQFTTMLDLIEAWLAHEQIGFVGLRGSVHARKRGELIRRFNRDPECRVCCASLLAGGTGIDLTGAQVVIHYDRWWNPAKEEQATARVHRMGQQQPVQVYKLVTVGTLEEKIHRIMEKKRQLAADLVAEDDASILKTLDRGQLAELFRLSGQGG